MPVFSLGDFEVVHLYLLLDIDPVGSNPVCKTLGNHWYFTIGNHWYKASLVLQLSMEQKVFAMVFGITNDWAPSPPISTVCVGGGGIGKGHNGQFSYHRCKYIKNVCQYKLLPKIKLQFFIQLKQRINKWYEYFIITPIV